jgi:hypothetical protein
VTAAFAYAPRGRWRAPVQAAVCVGLLAGLVVLAVLKVSALRTGAV